ncbi:hypothetical protein FHS42_002094 [Streptomyces zagrosensis]|uniref:Uncharacterized protein n=1 Tax=Streptomyces zagrosensis TaxID=1042984 RepID=A0A7W9Q7I2_9ACTN|nr:hypothetical protein [Streptomyces zagrosensis]
MLSCAVGRRPPEADDRLKQAGSRSEQSVGTLARAAHPGGRGASAVGKWTRPDPTGRCGEAFDRRNEALSR